MDATLHSVLRCLRRLGYLCPLWNITSQSWVSWSVSPSKMKHNARRRKIRRVSFFQTRFVLSHLTLFIWFNREVFMRVRDKKRYKGRYEWLREPLFFFFSSMSVINFSLPFLQKLIFYPPGNKYILPVLTNGVSYTVVRRVTQLTKSSRACNYVRFRFITKKASSGVWEHYSVIYYREIVKMTMFSKYFKELDNKPWYIFLRFDLYRIL